MPTPSCSSFHSDFSVKKPLRSSPKWFFATFRIGFLIVLGSVIAGCESGGKASPGSSLSLGEISYDTCFDEIIRIESDVFERESAEFLDGDHLARGDHVIIA